MRPKGRGESVKGNLVPRIIIAAMIPATRAKYSTMIVVAGVTIAAVFVFFSDLVVALIMGVIAAAIHLDFFDKEVRFILAELGDNKTFEDTLDTCNQLFARSSDVKIVSGHLDKRFYGNRTILASFEDILKKDKGRITIITGCLPEDTAPIVELSSHENFELYLADKETESHFMVGDDKNVRVEMRHKEGAKERKAFYMYDSKYLGERYSRRFDWLLSELGCSRADLGANPSKTQ